jgi:hypothetical protein
MCAICDGATDEEVRRRLADRIEWYGWGVQGVEASDENWGWAYTVGLVERFGHPELVVASMLDLNDLGELLNLLGDEIGSGRRFQPGVRTRVRDVELDFAKVHRRQFERGVFARWVDHYAPLGSSGPQLSALQVLLPAKYFCPVHAGPQPRLDLPTDVLRRPGRNRATRRGHRHRRRH